LADNIAALGCSSELVKLGVSELEQVCALLPEDLQQSVMIDLSLARGLDYYTGLIVEVGLIKYPEFGTVISGGRYDNLASEFTEQRLPGVGVSIGLTRFMELLFSEGLIDTSKKTPSVALVTVYSEADRARCNQLARELRAAGMPSEVYYKAPKLGKQIEYAEQRGIRYVVFSESAGAEIRIKDLGTKEQFTTNSLAEWARDAR
jgi:histidyl-tRNA synthetase